MNDKRIAHYEMNLPEGVFVLSVPMDLSEESVEEVSSMFALVSRQLLRWSQSRVSQPADPPAGEGVR